MRDVKKLLIAATADEAARLAAAFGIAGEVVPVEVEPGRVAYTVVLDLGPYAAPGEDDDVLYVDPVPPPLSAADLRWRVRWDGSAWTPDESEED